MKDQFTESNRILIEIKFILYLFLGFTVLYLMMELAHLFVPLFFALFFAVLFQPFVHFFMRFLSLNLSVVLTTIVTMMVFFFIGFGLFNVVQTLAANREVILNSISTDLRPFINNYTSYLGIIFQDGELRKIVADLLQSGSFWAASGSFISSLSSVSVSLLLMILYFAGLLGAITRFDDTITYLVGENKNKQKVLIGLNRIKDSISTYIKIKTYVSLITGLGTGVICLFFEIEYALLWGFLAFILNYIPYIGSLIAIIPPLVLAIIADNSLSNIFLIFICLEGIQLIMGNIVEPKWMGDIFSINTVTVLFCFVFWTFMWNTAGMLLAVPLTFMCKVILENMSQAQILVRLMDKKN